MTTDDMRHRVQQSFDRVWKRRLEQRRDEPGYTATRARGGRYKRLAELMGLPRQQCRIRQFSYMQCIIALDIIETGRLDRPRDGKK